MISAFEGLGGLLGSAAPYLASKLPFETVARDMAALQTVKASDLNALAKGAVKLDSGVLVLAGDKKVILEQLRGLKLPEPVEVTPTGEPVERK